MILKMSKYVQYKRVFNHFDENKDGKISPSELQQSISTIGGEAMSLKEAETAVGLLDTDMDGLIDLDEFMNFVDGGEEEDKNTSLKEAFKMYNDDEKDDEFITAKSLKRMLTRLGESKSIDECKAMISHFDLDGDGVLSFDEFKVMMA